MKYLSILFLFILPIIVFAQKEKTVYKIHYDEFVNDAPKDTYDIYYQDETVYLSDTTDQFQYYADLEQELLISTIQYEKETYLLSKSFKEFPKFTTTDETAQILDYTCKKVNYDYFSNKIEIWYTEESNAKGVPFRQFLPYKDALVLKIVINGNRIIKATSIKKVNDYQPQKNYSSQSKTVNESEFEELKIKSRYKVTSIFKDEIINFNPDLVIPTDDELVNDQVYHFSKGSVILKKIKVTDELKNSGHVFARLNCKSNGDAYDRTGSVFVLPAQKEGEISVLDAYQKGIEQLPIYTDNEAEKYQGITATSNYQPPIELMRFYTSFGADHFNKKNEINNYNWKNDVLYKQEVTGLIPLEEEEIWIGVFIGNYDNGGHIVSLELDVYPSFEESPKGYKPFIYPLFSTVNTLEMSGQNYGKLFGNDSLEVEFEITEDVEGLQLLFTSTGHGGWGGGDEFNPKLNEIFIDGEKVFSVVPWRTDCATNRLYNPASGNFGNGLSSSDLSRSNWCPAMLTPAYIIPLKDLKKGKHRLKVSIDQGKKEGSSFSHWYISGVLTGSLSN